MRMTTDFLSEAMQLRRQQTNNISKTGILCPAKIFQTERFKNISQQGRPIYLAKKISDFYLQRNTKPLVDSK